MSEEILKALAHLYAIITKQDGGVTETERNYVIASFKKKLSIENVRKYTQLYDEFVGYNEEKTEAKSEKEKLTSMKDSVKTLAICKKINKTLTHKQKIVVLVELLELVRSDGKYTPQRKQIIETVSDAFNITKDEHLLIEKFVLQQDVNVFVEKNFLVINKRIHEQDTNLHIHAEHLEGDLIFIHVPSADMIFLKYLGTDTIVVNSYPAEVNSVILFPSGSIVKLSRGDSFYYSSIYSHFASDSNEMELSFNVSNLEYKFPNGATGLHDITISEGPGTLIGIMGASGAGKTTLLNVLAGLEKPSAGSVLLNGLDLHKHHDKIKGMIGYIAQEDLLIEELTVFENLYYNARLCFKDYSEEEIVSAVNRVLEDLGLFHIKHLQVGNVLNKKISGGQRKRLNIALELIREPSVLFVDEPTSGLSSRDSENVMDLLKELSRKGTLIFVVIHQPSSDIFKLFDKLLILDTGGHLIFNGNPVEAVTYFKKISQQVDSDHGQCQLCGNVNPEQIFNIIEEKVVDEYGNFTSQRKTSPLEWREYYNKGIVQKKVEDLKDAAFKMLKVPMKLVQFFIFTVRDIKSKWSNTQYMIINLLEAPLLAFILAFVIRYNNDHNDTTYSFRYNDNIPAYLLMSIVVALFMGLSISAEEIIKDRKILKRESFLNLSRFSYLSSKIFVLFSFSAIQTFTFVCIGNSLMHIKGMFLSYWLVLFTVSCMANILGLMISSAFRSAITVYILIPLLLIPQMILSGAMFSFDKVNDFLRKENKVPLIADFMASRWAFEALAVKQFRDNDYQAMVFAQEQKERVVNFSIVYTFPKIQERLEEAKEYLNAKSDSLKQEAKESIVIAVNEFRRNLNSLEKGDQAFLSALNISNVKVQDIETLLKIKTSIEKKYQDLFNKISLKKEEAIDKIAMEGVNMIKLQEEYFNESLADLVRGANSKVKYSEYDGRIVPKIDMIYFNPVKIDGALDYRSHFFSPMKHFAGNMFDTFWFNIGFIWWMSVCLFVLLYFDVLKYVIELPEKILTKINRFKL